MKISIDNLTIGANKEQNSPSFAKEPSPNEIIESKLPIETPILEGFGNYEEMTVGVFYESRCLLKTKTDNFKSHWVVVEGNEIFCYRKKGDQ